MDSISKKPIGHILGILIATFVGSILIVFGNAWLGFYIVPLVFVLMLIGTLLNRLNLAPRTSKITTIFIIVFFVFILTPLPFIYKYTLIKKELRTIPIYPGGSNIYFVVEPISGDSQAFGSINYNLKSTEKGEQIRQYYVDELKKAGWTIESLDQFWVEMYKITDTGRKKIRIYPYCSLDVRSGGINEATQGLCVKHEGYKWFVNILYKI